MNFGGDARYTSDGCCSPCPGDRATFGDASLNYDAPGPALNYPSVPNLIGRTPSGVASAKLISCCTGLHRLSLRTS